MADFVDSKLLQKTDSADNHNLGYCGQENDNTETSCTKRRKVDSIGDIPNQENEPGFTETCQTVQHSFEAKLSPASESESSHVKTVSDKMWNNCTEENEETDGNWENSSDISDISNLSIDESRWTNCAGSGPVEWIQRQMAQSVDPRDLLNEIFPGEYNVPANVDNFILWKSILNFLMDPPKREKLEHINTFDDTLNLIQRCSRIMILTGAGVSVSCGIPDFRSKDGIYAHLAAEYPDLPDPQAMFDIKYFQQDARPFFKFAKEIYPGQFDPSPSHKFIRMLEQQGKLLRNYTQNIDTLEQVAGIQNVINCHGSFISATCMVCKSRVNHKCIEDDIMNQVIPHCKKCDISDKSAIMKPDIVFFGESLPEQFHTQIEGDKNVCDLLIVMGSSLKVRPVALIPNSLPGSVPQILINREPLKHLDFDVELLGDCDTIISELCRKLGKGYESLSIDHAPLSQVSRDDMVTPPLIIPENEKYSIDNGAVDTQKEKEKQYNANTGDDPCKSIEENTECKVMKGAGSETANSQINNKKGIKIEEKMLNKTTLSGQIRQEILDPDIETSKSYWEPIFVNIPQQLEENTFLFIPPNRYIFKGADFFQNVNEVDEDTSSDSFVESDLNFEQGLPADHGKDKEDHRKDYDNHPRHEDHLMGDKVHGEDNEDHGEDNQKDEEYYLNDVGAN